MKPKAKYTRICMVGSIYSLFLYLLITDKHEYNSTLFIMGNVISDDIKSNLQNVISIDDNNFIKGNWYNRFYQKYKLYHFTRKKIKELDFIPIFGHDHLTFSSGLIGKRKITVIEDGLANYTQSSYLINHSWWKKILYPSLYGRLTVQNKYGTSKFVDKVILTELTSIPEVLLDKSEIIKPNIIWNECTIDKKKYICNVFNLDTDDIEKFKSKSIILLTYPFYKSDQNEVISKYEKILDKIDRSQVLIKTHPRDKFNYKEKFPDILVYNKPIPFELFVLMGCEFRTIITINSSAVCNLPSSTNIIHL